MAFRQRVNHQNGFLPKSSYILGVGGLFLFFLFNTYAFNHFSRLQFPIYQEVGVEPVLEPETGREDSVQVRKKLERKVLPVDSVAVEKQNKMGKEKLNKRGNKATRRSTEESMNTSSALKKSQKNSEDAEEKKIVKSEVSEIKKQRSFENANVESVKEALPLKEDDPCFSELSSHWPPYLLKNKIFHSRRNIFIDLGANDGRSLDYYLSTMRGISQGPLDASFEVFLFDLNPKFRDTLTKKCRDWGSKHSCQVVMAAAWTQYGPISFFEDKKKTKNSKKKLGVYNAVGSSLFNRESSKPGKGVWRDGGACSFHFSHWLKQLVKAGVQPNSDKQPFVFVKMDIEGSEYKVLQDLLDSDKGLKSGWESFLTSGSIGLISELAVEWHPSIVQMKDEEATRKNLQSLVEQRGVKLADWDL